MVMNRIRQQCNAEKLSALLTDGIAEPDDQALLEHLEGCAACRQKLANLSGDPMLWESVRQVLTASDRTSAEGNFQAILNDLSFANQNASFNRDAAAVSRVLLGEPRHPEMLGRIGRYDVERLIGSGGMGIVYKGFDTELNRPVAIKILAPAISFSGSARQRFAREAKAAAAVVHEHVVPIYDVESGGEFPYLVMHYAQGDSLQCRIDKQGPLELTEILRIAKQIASGLAAAHAQGLAHRDVKPANVLLENGVERALLTDFGLAQAKDDASLTCSGFLPGTPQYMSPEQARGEKVNALSDLFSMGSVLYAMCTGRPPFRGESSLAVLQKIPTATPKPIREINPAIPQWLCVIVDRLMMKTADKRFQSATEVASLLEQCLAHLQQPLEVQLPDAIGRQQGESFWQSRRQRLTLFLLLIGVLFVPVAAWLWAKAFTADATVASVPLRQPDSAPADAAFTINAGIVSENQNTPPIQWHGAPVPRTADDDLRSKLNDVVSVDWQSTTLVYAIAELFSSADIDIEFADNIKESAPTLSSETVTLNSHLSRSQLLDRVLPKHGLGYIVRDSRVEINTIEGVNDNPTLTRYDLSHLTNNSLEAVKVKQLVAQMIEPLQWAEQGGNCSLALMGPVLYVRATEPMHRQIHQLLSALTPIQIN